MCVLVVRREVREAVSVVEIAEVGRVCGRASFPISGGWCRLFLLFESGREASGRFFIGGGRVSRSGGDWGAWLGVTDGDGDLWGSSPAFGRMR